MEKRAIPYLTLTETTNEYMLASMNDKRKYFINYLNHAKWIWKELLWSTIWSIKHKYVEVDCTTSPKSITIPSDMVRFVNVSVGDDCDNMRSLAFNDSMKVLPTPTAANKTCDVCGETKELNECVSNITVVQKPVVIDDETYMEKIWKKVCENGDVVEVREVPTKSYPAEGEDWDLEWVTIQKHICQLKVKKCGCIEKTEENKTLIKTHCGCFLVDCVKEMCNPLLSKSNRRFGAIKIQDGRIFLQGNIPDQVILSYQTNGECGEDELMIPEYAVPAVIFGIGWRAIALKPGGDKQERREFERNYGKAKQDLAEFINPIIMSEFMNVQMSIPKWGSNSDQRDIWEVMYGIYE